MRRIIAYFIIDRKRVLLKVGEKVKKPQNSGFKYNESITYLIFHIL